MILPVLAVSDQIDPRIYSATLRQRLGGQIALVISCGDLPARYLEFLADALDRPVYYVLGNHAEELVREGERGKRYLPMGCIDLGGTVIRDEHTGLLLAGIPGSPRYNDREANQYTEVQIWGMVVRMLPRLLWNRLRYGRWLDVLVTHTPPRAVNDRPDPAHRGFVALRQVLRWFHPPYLLHGHVHLYDRSRPFSAEFAGTRVINVYPYHVLDLDLPEGVANPLRPRAAADGDEAPAADNAAATVAPDPEVCR